MSKEKNEKSLKKLLPKLLNEKVKIKD